MRTVGEILKTGYLPRKQAELLLGFIFNLKPLDLYLHFDLPLQPEELQRAREIFKKAKEGTPVEYLIGVVDFFDMSIKVTPDVLIPRPETELLLYHVVKMTSGKGILFDVCCGSGCIGLSLKKKLPDLEVYLSDLSPAALSVARENGKDLRVTFFEGDLLHPFQGLKADVVISNPPYVIEGSLEDNGEPHMARFAGVKGIEFYERLKNELPLYLNDGAKIFFEIGYNQGLEVVELFQEPHWINPRFEPDWSGKDRFFFTDFSLQTYKSGNPQ
jgi:release factor glutamine methyltransferase